VDVAVLLPSLFSVRNVVYSGLLRRLVEGGLRVAVLPKVVPPASGPGVFSDFRLASTCEPLRTITGSPQRGRALLQGVLASAFARRNRIVSYALYRSWYGRRDSRAERLRRRIVDGVGRIAAWKAVGGGLSRLAERLYRRAHDLEPVREHLRRLRPRMVWSTTCTSPLEYPYVLAARDLGIPVVASILSFDNLSSRSELPVFDRYTVWSYAMRNELLAYYPEVSSEDVVITGAVQFDFHTRPDMRWSRERTLGELGLRPGSRYFLYAASHETLAPQEPELVRELAARMRTRPGLAAVDLVVRLHPQDDGRRWAGVADPDGRTVLSSACDARPEADGWKLPRPEEQPRLVSSLLHAEACLNIVSTMSLDAALLDRPVIGLELSGEPEAPRDIMYSEYGATHYLPLVASGGLRLARDWGQLLDLMERALASPESDRAERARMVAESCGPTDGGAALRVSESVGRFVRELSGLRPAVRDVAPAAAKVAR
jgi:hypothetical protein